MTAVHAPLTATAVSRSAPWVVSLFAASVLLQRLSLPGGIVPLLLPLAAVWVLWGLWAGVLEWDPRRTLLFLAVAATTALSMVVQSAVLVNPVISITSWGLLMAVWFPSTLRLVHRGRADFQQALRGCVSVGEWLAAACLLMMATQLAGLAYRDWVAAVVPQSLLVTGYVITYPIDYLSPIYRANAWIGLEPSIVSLQLGVCLVAAVLVGARVRTLLLLLAGLATTMSGSGILIAIVAGVVLALHPIRRRLTGMALAGAGVAAVAMFTEAGRALAQRSTEVVISGSSASLRAIEPYRVLWPTWTGDLTAVLIGSGAGASQQALDSLNISGLLLPSPLKVFVDYGVIAGTLLAVYLLFCYLDAPSRALGLSLLVSAWVLQPGTTTFVLVMPVLLLVTWWAPRVGAVVEVVPLERTEGVRA